MPGGAVTRSGVQLFRLTSPSGICHRTGAVRCWRRRSVAGNRRAGTLTARLAWQLGLVPDSVEDTPTVDAVTGLPVDEVKKRLARWSKPCRRCGVTGGQDVETSPVIGSLRLRLPLDHNPST